MTQGFKEYLKSLMDFNATDSPHKGIVSNQETETKLSYNIQKGYRNGVGFLLYLVKHSRPELSNAVCESSKCM